MKILVAALIEAAEEIMTKVNYDSAKLVNTGFRIFQMINATVA